MGSVRTERKGGRERDGALEVGVVRKRLTTDYCYAQTCKQPSSNLLSKIILNFGTSSRNFQGVIFGALHLSSRMQETNLGAQTLQRNTSRPQESPQMLLHSGPEFFKENKTAAEGKCIRRTAGANAGRSGVRTLDGLATGAVKTRC